MNKKIIKTAVGVLFAASAGAASAATSFTWDLLGTDNSCTAGCANTSNTRTYTSTVGNQSMTVRALYSVVSTSGTLETNVLGSTFRSQESASSVVAAQLGQYSSNGMGLSNPIDVGTANTVETSTGGHHAVDNIKYSSTSTTKGMDFLLFDFGAVMSAESFQIGWKGSDSDMDFLLGPANASTVNFTNLDGTSNGTTVQSLLNNGWTRLSMNDVADCVPTVSGCPTAFGSAFNGKQGRYLIAAGALGGTNDAFKFSQITMQMSSGGSTPIPGTAALLLVGIAGMALNRRRVTKAA